MELLKTSVKAVDYDLGLALRSFKFHVVRQLDII